MNHTLRLLCSRIQTLPRDRPVPQGKRPLLEADMNHHIRTLTVLTLAAIAASSILWSAAVFMFPSCFPLALAGIAAAALAMGLVWRLALTHRRALAELERTHREKLEAQQRSQSEALAQAAASAREEMDAFRSRLAHTLRMPVAIIQGYADLLTSGVVTENSVREEYLKKISDRSQYITEAISRQFAPGQSLDSSHLNYSDLDLLTLVHQAAADMQTAAADQGVTIQVVSSQEHIPLRADGYLIDRVLFNLLENLQMSSSKLGKIFTNFSSHVKHHAQLSRNTLNRSFEVCQSSRRRG